LKQKSINFFAGPGAGKSTTACGLFFQMKMRGHRCEYVPEYAKDLAYEGLLSTIPQSEIFREQNRRMQRLVGKVEYIITDAPLVLGLLYAPDGVCEEQTRIAFDSFDNYNVLVLRDKPYEAYGREQTEEQAKQLDEQIGKLGITVHFRVYGNLDAPMRVLFDLHNRYNIPPTVCPRYESR